MSTLYSFKDGRGGCFANVRMDNGDPMFISVAQTGVLVKKSRLGWFGPKLYQSSTVNDAAETARALDSLFPEYVVPDGMTNAALRSFTNAVLHCSSTPEVARVLNTAIEGVRGEQSAAVLKAFADFLDAEQSGAVPSIDLQATANAIIRTFGDVLVTVSKTEVEKYPAGVYPVSLLPIPRPALEKLLKIEIDDSSSAEERQMLERSLALLDGFIDDQRANDQNAAFKTASGPVSDG
jgi:hypothetical protein